MRTLTFEEFENDCEKIMAGKELVLVKIPHLDGQLDDKESVYGFMPVTFATPGRIIMIPWRDLRVRFSTLSSEVFVLADNRELFCLIGLNSAMLQAQSRNLQVGYEEILTKFSSEPNEAVTYMRRQKSFWQLESPLIAREPEPEKVVTMTELRRHFFRIVREVEETKTVYIVTRRGQPIVRIVPV